MILRPPRRMNPLFPRYFCRVEARRFTIGALSCYDPEGVVDSATGETGEGDEGTGALSCYDPKAVVDSTSGETGRGVAACPLRICGTFSVVST